MCKFDRGSTCNCNMPAPKIVGSRSSFTIEYPVGILSPDGIHWEWYFPSDKKDGEGKKPKILGEKTESQISTGQARKEVRKWRQIKSYRGT